MATACSCASRVGKPYSALAQASDWTNRFKEIAKSAADLPDGLIDGEIVALDGTGSPDFAGLQAALSDGDTSDLIFFAFDLLFSQGEDLRVLPLSERKSRLKAMLSQPERSPALCRTLHQ
jgi:bifunctional non-homologous end joining protein LigD